MGTKNCDGTCTCTTINLAIKVVVAKAIIIAIILAPKGRVIKSEGILFICFLVVIIEIVCNPSIRLKSHYAFSTRVIEALFYILEYR